MIKSLTLMVLAIAAAVAMYAQEKAALSEDEGKILALESVWNRAEQAKDVSALSKLFART